MYNSFGGINMMYNSFLLENKLRKIKREIDSILLLEQRNQDVRVSEEVATTIKNVNKKFFSFLYDSLILKNAFVKTIVSYFGMDFLFRMTVGAANFEKAVSDVLRQTEYKREAIERFFRAEEEGLKKLLGGGWLYNLVKDALEKGKQETLARVEEYERELEGKEKISVITKTYRRFMEVAGGIAGMFPFLSVAVIVFVWAFLTSGILTKDVLTLEKIGKGFNEALGKFFTRLKEIASDPESYSITKVLKILLSFFLSPFILFYDFVSSMELEEYYIGVLLGISFLLVLLEIITKLRSYFFYY